MRPAPLSILIVMTLFLSMVGIANAAGLGTSPSWTSFSGTHVNQILGVGLAQADVNGDGFADVIIADPNARDFSSGQVLIFFGSATGPGASANQVLVGGDGLGFGTGLCSAADWNGDGYEDLAIGSSSGSGGTVAVYLGSPSGLSATPTWSASGTGAFGQIVASAGDVNGDGFSDILTADSRAPVGPLTRAGRAYLFLGGPGAATSPAWTMDGDTAEALLGGELNGADDVNGDGFDDFLISQNLWIEYQMIHNKLTAVAKGRVFLFLGSTSGPTGPVWVTTGNINGAYGWAVGAAGDLNGDGYGDFFVSDNQEKVEVRGGGPKKTSGAYRGRVYVYYGSLSTPSTSPSWIGTGDLDNSYFGNDVVAGDVNHDGFSDLIVAASQRTNTILRQGRIYAYLGSASGLATIEAWFVDGPQEDAGNAGLPMATGPVNGDLFDDLLVGMPSFDTQAALNAGVVFLYLGQSN